VFTFFIIPSKNKRKQMKYERRNETNHLYLQLKVNNQINQVTFN